MKKLLLLLAAAGFWLTGYYFGQRPGSPDLYDWANVQVERFEAAGGREKVGQAVQTAREKITDLLKPQSADEVEPADPAAEASLSARSVARAVELAKRR